MKLKAILNKSIDDSKGAFEKVKKILKNKEKLLIVTLNPEGVMKALEDDKLYNIFMNKKTILVCESVAIQWSIKKLFKVELDLQPGIEFFKKILEYSKKNNNSIYLYGAKEEIVSSLYLKLKNQNINVLGYKNGYDTKIFDKELYKEISNLEPDIIAFALGVGRQELELNELSKNLNKGVLIGIGGSFDVLSGVKKRAPKIMIKLKIEWLYRIIIEPYRLKRFWNNNLKFAFKVLKEKRIINNK